MCIAYGEGVVFNWKREGRLSRATFASCAAMEYCNGCGKDVSGQQEKKRRRLLSDATAISTSAISSVKHRVKASSSYPEEVL